MFNLKTLGLTLVLSVSLLSADAQEKKVILNEPDYNKPRLFNHLPDVIPVTVEELSSLLGSEAGKTISFKLNDKKTASLNGTVSSVESKYNGELRSAVLRCTDYPGATFALTALKEKDGTLSYTGRIVSLKHGDILELQQKGDTYFFIKKNFHDLINE